MNECLHVLIFGNMHLYYETAELYYRIAKTNLLHEKENSAIAVNFFFLSKIK